MVAAFTADYIESIKSQWLQGVCVWGGGLDLSFRAVVAGQKCSFNCGSFVHVPLLWVKDLQRSLVIIAVISITSS